MTDRLDALERRAVEVITSLYGPIHEDDTAAFWVQKGIEGMRLAIAEEADPCADALLYIAESDLEFPAPTAEALRHRAWQALRTPRTQ